MEQLTWDNYIRFLSKRFGVATKKLAPESRFTDDLGLDSLSLYSLIEDIEKDYDIGIEISDVVDLRTVGRVYHYIREKFDMQAAQAV